MLPVQFGAKRRREVFSLQWRRPRRSLLLLLSEYEAETTSDAADDAMRRPGFDNQAEFTLMGDLKRRITLLGHSSRHPTHASSLK